MKNLIQFHADKEDESYVWTKIFIESTFQDAIKNPLHSGDCTDENFTCNLCLIESMLSEYHKYVKEKS